MTKRKKNLMLTLNGRRMIEIRQNFIFVLQKTFIGRSLLIANFAMVKLDKINAFSRMVKIEQNPKNSQYYCIW